MINRKAIPVKQLDYLNRVFLSAVHTVDKVDENAPIFYLILNRSVEDLRLCLKENNRTFITSKMRRNIKSDLKQIMEINTSCKWDSITTSIAAIDILETAYEKNLLMRP